MPSAAPGALLRRALLYVPGSSKRMLEKSRELNVDCVTYDLEDAVTLAQKPAARFGVRHVLAQPRALGIREQAVRINAVDTKLALEDLTEVLKAPYLDTIVVPKVNRASDLTFVENVIDSSTHPNKAHIQLLALIESARAIMDISSICRSTPRLRGLIFAAEDFSLDLSLTRTPSLREFLFARQTLVTASRAYGLDSSIDLVCTDYRDAGVLEAECADGAAMGFSGKQCIHPAQVETVQRAFAPARERVRDAVRILVAEEKAEAMGKGSWGLGGKMVDRPVIEAARKVVEKARAAGVDVEKAKEEVGDVEPE